MDARTQSKREGSRLRFCERRASKLREGAARLAARGAVRLARAVARNL